MRDVKISYKFLVRQKDFSVNKKQTPAVLKTYPPQVKTTALNPKTKQQKKNQFYSNQKAFNYKTFTLSHACT